MRKVWAVVRREFLERVRTKQFVIGTLFGPALMAAVFVAPLLLERSSRAKRIAVLDTSEGRFGRRITDALERATREGESDSARRYKVVHRPAAGRLDQVRDSLVALTDRSSLGSAALDGVLVVTEDALDSNTIVYLGGNAGSLPEMAALRRILVPAVLTEKLVRSGMDASGLLETIQPVELRTIKVSQGRLTGESGNATFALAYIMAFVLY
ncbi:MAG: ABC transporter permease, partial [bacterium]